MGGSSGGGIEIHFGALARYWQNEAQKVLTQELIERGIKPPKYRSKNVTPKPHSESEWQLGSSKVRETVDCAGAIGGNMSQRRDGTVPRPNSN